MASRERKRGRKQCGSSDTLSLQPTRLESRPGQEGTEGRRNVLFLPLANLVLPRLQSFILSCARALRADRRLCYHRALPPFPPPPPLLHSGLAVGPIRPFEIQYPSAKVIPYKGRERGGGEEEEEVCSPPGVRIEPPMRGKEKEVEKVGKKEQKKKEEPGAPFFPFFFLSPPPLPS